jgi:FkbM family methyltransferase
LGRGDREIAVRDGLTYDLDLSQGIDFAIFLGAYERQTKAALRRLVVPGSLVLDIGANIGAHTLPLAKQVGPEGRILAFEPTDFAFRKLSRNLELNPKLADRVTTNHCFLTATDADRVPTAIYSSWPLEQQPGLHAKHLGREMRTEAARARSVDSVLAELGGRQVQLVKLDVDGFECDVLRGARDMLSTMRPVFVMEIAPYVLVERGASLDEFLSFFVPTGYKFYDEQTERPLPSTAPELLQMIGDGGSINVIARAT